MPRKTFPMPKPCGHVKAIPFPCDRPEGHEGNHSAVTNFGHTNWDPEPAAPAPSPAPTREPEQPWTPRPGEPFWVAEVVGGYPCYWTGRKDCRFTVDIHDAKPFHTRQECAHVIAIEGLPSTEAREHMIMLPPAAPPPVEFVSKCCHGVGLKAASPDGSAPDWQTCVECGRSAYTPGRKWEMDAAVQRWKDEHPLPAPAPPSPSRAGEVPQEAELEKHLTRVLDAFERHRTGFPLDYETATAIVESARALLSARSRRGTKP